MPGPLTPDEMVKFASVAVETRESIDYRFIQKQGNLYPTMKLTIRDSPSRWVELDLSDEVFIVDVESGYGFTISEWLASEQKELLEELLDLAGAYLRGNWSIQIRKGLFGRSRQVMVVNTTQKEYILVKRKRR